MTLVKFNPHRSIDPWVDGICNSLFKETAPFTKQYVSVNIAESADKYEVELAVPGFNKSDFNIHLENAVLQVSGEKKVKEQEADNSENSSKKRYSKREFHYQSFSRSFNLPEDVDDNKISASYTDGILSISILKKETEKDVVKQIEIK